MISEETYGESTETTSRAAEPQSIVGRMMTRDPLTVQPGTSLHRALGLLVTRDLGGLPVVDRNGMIVGSLTEQDLLGIFAKPNARTVGEVMDTEPITIEVSESIVEVVDMMMSNGMRRVYVREGPRLVGIVSRSDLMPAILERLRERAEQAQGQSVSLVKYLTRLGRTRLRLGRATADESQTRH